MEYRGCGRLTLLPQCLEGPTLATSLTPTPFRKTRTPCPASLSSYDLFCFVIISALLARRQWIHDTLLSCFPFFIQVTSFC
uniref:Uncharacterized protein n=1 Tax=Sus scrofa TaxID=9823 RepID=A0A4X1SQ79_PIG